MQTPSNLMESLQLVLLTGLSGSGKTVALHALEDLGYYCVDNLPPQLLLPLLKLPKSQRQSNCLAIAIDSRSGESLSQMPALLDQLVKTNINLKLLFLDSNTNSLILRYSETRRKHPLTQGIPANLSSNGHSEQEHAQRALLELIEDERELLAQLRERSHIIDTSLMRASQLQSYVKAIVQATFSPLTLVFESFAFKRGIPMDADFVFDVRMLPNPHYEAPLKALTGRDAPVIAYLQAQSEVKVMQQHITNFVSHWLPHLIRDHRSYVTVAIGCTGGQHRSVYLVEQLAHVFAALSQTKSNTDKDNPTVSNAWVTLKRHRELDAG